METIGELIKKRNDTVNNGNTDKVSNNDINDNNGTRTKKNKYALDRTKFIPNTPQTQLAEKIAITLGDLQNYACYLNVVNKIGVQNAERLLRSTLSDINEKENTKYPVRKKGGYFMNKYKFKRY